MREVIDPNKSCAIFIPVLDRPHRVEPLLESLLLTEPKVGPVLRPVFVCSPGDKDEIAAVRAAGVEPLITSWDPARGDYARKMNLAWRETSDRFAFLAADDLVFHVGWITEALSVHAWSHACVVGTNDAGNPRVMSGLHSTHTLVCREYGECGTIDNGKLLLHEGYWHNFVDDEFIRTAQFRETYAFAERAVVEHMHPDWKKGVWDDTYAKGKEKMEEDRQYFWRRAHLWGQVQR